MKSNLIAIILFAIIAGSPSCTSPKENSTGEMTEAVVVNDEVADNAHNSMNSLDWAGTYFGTVPCASCEGIETELILNEDETYKLTTNYLGRNDALEQEKTGTFTWSADGSTITLSEVDNGSLHYKVGENQLWQLDMKGKKIEGDLADHYILKKK